MLKELKVMSLFKNKSLQVLLKNAKLNIGQTDPNDFSSEGVAVEKKNLPTEEKRIVYYAQKVILKKNVGNVFKKVAMMRSKRLLTG